MIELACRYCGMTQRALAAELGVSEHAIGKQRRRLLERLADNAVLADRLTALAESITADISGV